jgi:hypothetical protein
MTGRDRQGKALRKRNFLDKAEVTGSSPVSPITAECRKVPISVAFRSTSTARAGESVQTGVCELADGRGSCAGLRRESCA